MCTLTYLPLSDEQFIITTNRDESPKRPLAEFPAFHAVESRNIMFPKDPQAGGTWIAAADNGTSVCLLNGAFEPHEHQPPYKMSRGLVLKEAVECINPEEFIKNFDFSGIEPFTLVMLFHQPHLRLMTFRWDGNQKHTTENDPEQPQIWASAQLYNKQAIENREKWFSEWLGKHKEFSSENIKQFHQNAGSGDLQNDMVMDRGIVKTVCITQVVSLKGVVTMSHHDLMRDQQQSLSLSQQVNQEFSHGVL